MRKVVMTRLLAAVPPGTEVHIKEVQHQLGHQTPKATRQVVSRAVGKGLVERVRSEYVRRRA